MFLASVRDLGNYFCQCFGFIETGSVCICGNGVEDRVDLQTKAKSGG